MMFYLTYNDHPSGVYWSQVTDVVAHLNTLGRGRVRLVALVSLRGFQASRRAIRQRSPDALVLPMVPRGRNWKANRVLLRWLCRWYRPTGIMCRGVFATDLALNVRQEGLVEQVVFDARAAYGAEWEEFRVMDDDRLIAESARVEERAVHRADVRLAVSQALVDHWKERYGYLGDRHVVVPCTLGRAVRGVEAMDAQDGGMRASWGWSADDVVMVYSGTVVGWQSLELLERTVAPWLQAAARHRLLFLSGAHPVIDKLAARFPGQVMREWVEHHEVAARLSACDMGLLLRDMCITNRVASPTKFAEYLSCGLPVVISEGVGDFSQMVQEMDLGMVLGPSARLPLERTPAARRERMREVAASHFDKSAHDRAYGTLLDHLAHGPLEWVGSAPDTLPLVSIVVPSYNKRSFIGDMVASVQAQTDGRWELIVVDDGSTDGSQEFLQGLAAVDDRIRVLCQPRNRGANHCRNVGITEARGAYVILLDADDLLAPHCVAQRLVRMKASGAAFMVFTMEVFEEKPGDSRHRWVPDSTRALVDFFRHKLPWQTMQPIWDRRFLEALHGFDEAFTRHQDVELHTRALLHAGPRWRAFPGEPDCHYRIAEERKVGNAMRLLERFSESAVLFRAKFLEDARQMGRADLLLGIIHRTYLQVLLYAKSGRIDREQLRYLEARLLPQSSSPNYRSGSALFRVTRWYNLMPVRLPGVNRLLFELLTR